MAGTKGAETGKAAEQKARPGKAPAGKDAAAGPTPRPDRVILVGGAPRSGTTVTHALICTAPEVSEYHPEISFARPIFESYVVGMAHWNGHTKRFFATQEQFRTHARAQARRAMSQIWAALDRPAVLCVKDPLLTPQFPAVDQVLGWPCQFVTVLRHPHDVVRSQQEVYARSGVEMSDIDVHRICRQYLDSYAHIDDPALAGKLYHFRYEDLGQDWQVEALRGFTGLPGIDPARVWADRRPNPGTAAADPFFSPKYLNRIDTTPRLDPLDDRLRRIANHLCAPLMERCGYRPDGSFETW